MEREPQERDDSSDDQLPLSGRKLEKYLDRKRAKYAAELRRKSPPSISQPPPASPQDYYSNGWPSPRVDRSPVEYKKPRRVFNLSVSLVTIHVTADVAKSLLPNK